MDTFHITTQVTGDFDAVVEQIENVLKTEGFGIITMIDVKETLKKRINVDFRNYKILGACNPTFAHKAILAEDKVGVFLPCNVVVQQKTDGIIEVSAMDPVGGMQLIGNAELTEIAIEIRGKLARVIQAL
ncbi:MAG: DUF302 domain-containing protein [Bacteroidetes bacterium]|nr:DUF302 domain-containing protein [Bacteroidota bacterium]MBU1718723.1 DUF302 domain-containing protein [Bacteroidota bacterium]